MDVEQQRRDSLSTTTTTTTTALSSSVGYSAEWERKYEAQYFTYVYNGEGVRGTQSICWLYAENDAMFCRLCKKYQMKRCRNGKENLWATTGVTALTFHKVRMHQSDKVHCDAQMQEWTLSKIKPERVEPVKPEMKNALFASIYLSHGYAPFDLFEPLCELMEKLEVEVPPSNTFDGNHRPTETAICLHEIIAKQLRTELLEKVKASPVLGWLMHQAQCKGGEKVCVVYVRYLEKWKVKTSQYTVFRFHNENSVKHFGNRLLEAWKADGLYPDNSCCLFLEQFSASADVMTNICKPIHGHLKNDAMQLFVNITHPFSLLGSQTTSDLIRDFDWYVSEIYDFVRPIDNEQCKLKSWRHFLEFPEVCCQSQNEIRWSNIHGSIKPIFNNVRLVSQGLLKLYRDFINDANIHKSYRDKFEGQLNAILKDEFLIPLYVLHDLHEMILGPLMKATQTDQVNSSLMMKVFREKRELLEEWLSNPNSVTSPALANYLRTSQHGSFGAYQVNIGERQKTLQDVREYLQEVLNDFIQRLSFRPIEEDFVLLFDPQNLIDNQNNLLQPEYGRAEIERLRHAFQRLPNFNHELVLREWIHFKPLLKYFLANFSITSISEEFWKHFVTWQQMTNGSHFDQQFKNILLLLNIHLITLRNNVECAAGFSAAARIPKFGEFPLVLDLFNVRMSVRLLLKDGLENPQSDPLIEKILRDWNQEEFDQRVEELQAFIDQTTETLKRKTSLRLAYVGKIRCANGCNRFIATKPTEENGVIACSHNNSLYESLNPKYNCSRRLCRDCRTELKLKADEFWFCNDHVDLSNED